MPRLVFAQFAMMLGAALATALGPAHGQTADSSLFRLDQPADPSRLRIGATDPSAFRPAADGTPGRFRPAAPGRNTANRPRIAESPPVAPIPPASGAAATGFDSTNVPKSRKPRRAKTPAESEPAAKEPPARPEPAVTPPAVLPATFATRPVRGDRRGSGVAAPPDPAALPQRKRVPPPEPDYFEPVGVRAGAFTLFPAVELSGGYDSNPAHVPNSGGSMVGIVAPELKVRSNWQRHALNADAKGTYSTYSGTFVPSLDRPALDARVNGRIDATRLSTVDLQGRFIVGTDNPGSPNVQAGVAKFPIYTTLGGTLAYTRQFNRFALTAKGTADRTVYQQSELTDGTTASNDDRNFNQYGLGLRGSYELTPGVKPFVEVTADTRDHDLAIDRTGLRRDSDGYAVKGGTTFELTRKLTGEISGGWLARRYADPALPELSGATIDASLVFAATPLTTFTGTARSTADEVILPGVSGVLRRDITIQVDHAFRRWLTATAKFGVGIDDYVGSPRHDQRYLASLALTYKLTRELQLKGEVRRDWLHSNVAGVDYGANLYLLGIRLQR